MPFGRGKRFMGNANRFVDGAGLAGRWHRHYSLPSFTVGAGNWGPTNPLHVYKHGAPITDCRSGVCHKEYQVVQRLFSPDGHFRQRLRYNIGSCLRPSRQLGALLGP